MVNHPGSTEEQLPDDILNLLPRVAYLSTACETASLLILAISRNPERADLPEWRDRMHDRCRLNHKFLGSLCFCNCHKSERREENESSNPQKTGLGADKPQA